MPLAAFAALPQRQSFRHGSTEVTERGHSRTPTDRKIYQTNELQNCYKINRYVNPGKFL